MASDAATPRQRLAPEVRRRQVLDAAVAVFSAEGFHGTSMDAVAARAGVSKPSVYAHGGSKEELFTACLRREAERLLRSVAGAAGPEAGGPGPAGTDPATDPRTRLRLGLRAFFRAVTMHREGWVVLYRQASTGPFAGEVDAVRRAITTQVAALLAEGLGVDPAAVEPHAHALAGAAEGLADWWLGMERRPGPDTAETLADLLMGMVWPGLDALRGATIAEYPAVSGRR